MIKYISMLIALTVLFLCSPTTYADDLEDVKKKSDYKWAVSLYGGIYTDGSLADMISFDADYHDSIKVMVAAISRDIFRYKDYFDIEVEGQVGYHWDDGEDYWEFASLLMGRWNRFVWDHYVETSVAAGAGFSYITEISPVELANDDDAQRFAGALAFEMTFGLPEYPQWDLLFRVHHRSGMGGVFGGGSSNYVTSGFRYSF